MQISSFVAEYALTHLQHRLVTRALSSDTNNLEESVFQYLQMTWLVLNKYNLSKIQCLLILNRIATKASM
ncbi:hypothetical protein RRG08_047144 [Elysia crispata]|uniref:Uncharacterized protein n=1 Tax=Elysia crispata TaxID=231223 RepID=A0AAE1E1V1_9GAST|nr:hypothetical protein RRG08_047144 [Elysia crispata]